MGCVQIEISSSGNKTLPAGVSIPGAYRADDPGILFNLYNGFTGSYTIPGPAVWDGASGPPVSPPPQETAATPSSGPTSANQPPPSPTNQQPPTTLQTRPASATSPPPASAPSSTAAAGPPNPPPPAALGDAYIWQQCGGINWSGAQGCCEGLVCTEMNPYYSQCLSGSGPRPASIWEQCGGQGWAGATTCHPGLACVGDQWYRQCRPA